MSDLTPGLELSRLFFEDAVRPILNRHYPALEYSAGLIGPGSEVLGFDTTMSADHNFGPRVQIFLSEADHARLAGDIRATLGNELPFVFHGFPTHFEAAPSDPESVVPVVTERRPINHRAVVTTLSGYVRDYTGIDLGGEITLLDWLTVPEQNLRTLAAGGVFYDGLDVLEPMRRRLAYYPHDVWLYLLSAQWQRVGQEEPFVGRTGIVGDDTGSAVITARLVRDLMRLCFLLERVYAPYSKWFGTAFARMDCASRLAPHLDGALRAASWQEREEHLVPAYEFAAAAQNALRVAAPVPDRVSYFYSRPFRVIWAERFARSLWDAIQDPAIRALPFGLGKVDQYVDSTDVLSHQHRCRAFSSLYREMTLTGEHHA